MSDHKSLEEITEKYFLQHPEEIDSFIQESFEAYAEDGDSRALLSQLRVVARVKGISNIASETGMSRRGVQYALSARGNPRLDNVNAIMNAMGYQLMPYKMGLGKDYSSDLDHPMD